MEDIQTLLAIEEIRRLEARYAWHADHKQWHELAELFTDDGWFRPLDASGNEVLCLHGRQEIGDILHGRNSGDVELVHQLFTHDIVIESPTAARAVWAMADLIFRGDSAMPQGEAGDTRVPFRTMRGWGHYHVTYRRVDGRWLISTRTLTRTRLEYTH